MRWRLSPITGVWINWRFRQWHFQIGKRWHLYRNTFWEEPATETEAEAQTFRPQKPWSRPFRKDASPMALYRTLWLVCD